MDSVLNTSGTDGGMLSVLILWRTYLIYYGPRIDIRTERINRMLPYWTACRPKQYL